MKLDTKAMRYLSSEDWRVLAAVEQGSKNHLVVPTSLIGPISGLRGGSGLHKCIATLAKAGLIAKVPNAKYDGYRLTYGGLDYLALNAHRKSGVIYSVGNQIGVGKESDIFVVASSKGTQHVLKIHRLGRISFRTVKANRDYLRNRSSSSWMHMSRLAAMKEYAFMQALHTAGFPVPTPLAQNRHTIVMELIDAFPLRQISSVPDPAALYDTLISLIVRLARRGLIHGDFNEFNILLHEGTEDQPETTPEKEQEQESARPRAVMIDFPQMISIDHANASEYFDRDVQCVKRYFKRRYGYEVDEDGEAGEARLCLDRIKTGRRMGEVEGEAEVQVEVEAVDGKDEVGDPAERGDGHGHGDGDEMTDSIAAAPSTAPVRTAVARSNKEQKEWSKRAKARTRDPGPIRREARLDVQVEAAGFSRRMAAELEKYRLSLISEGEEQREEEGEEEEEEEEGDEEEEEEEEEEESGRGEEGERP